MASFKCLELAPLGFDGFKILRLILCFPSMVTQGPNSGIVSLIKNIKTVGKCSSSQSFHESSMKTIHFLTYCEINHYQFWSDWQFPNVLFEELHFCQFYHPRIETCCFENQAILPQFCPHLFWGPFSVSLHVFQLADCRNFGDHSSHNCLTFEVLSLSACLLVSRSLDKQGLG